MALNNSPGDSLPHSLPDPGAPADSAGSAPSGSASADSTPDRFSLPTATRSPVIEALERVPEPPAVPSHQLAPRRDAPEPGSGAGISGHSASGAGAATVLEREAKARLLALRRIEWVAIALAAVLLGGATWSWRRHSDAVQAQHDAFNVAPLPFLGPGGQSLGSSGRRPRRASLPWRMARASEAKLASHSVASQLEAFKRDDYKEAARWQSSNLKRNFRSVAQFRSMIRGRYSSFTTFKSVKFGQARAQGDGSSMLLEVTLLGQNGAPLHAMYMLVREEGAYHIDGVSEMRPPSSSPARPGPAPDIPSDPIPPVESA